MKSYARRQFLYNISLATLGGMAGAGVGWRPARATTFDVQLAALISSSNTKQAGQLLGHVITDPALVTLAQGILQNNSSSLTGFQKSLVQAFLTAAPSFSGISAILAGKPLSNGQAATMVSVQNSLARSPAVLRLISAGNALRSPNASPLLQSYINQALGADVVALHPPTTLGDPNLDAIAEDIFTLTSSTQYQATISSLNQLARDPLFISFLLGNSPLLIASFIPVDVQLALLLPGDKDPFTPATVEAILEVIAAVCGAIFTIATLPADIAIALAVIAGIGIGAALDLAFFHLYKSIDCDFDGDPNDPADAPGVPGSECPA